MKKIILTTMLFCLLGQVIFSQAQTTTITGKVTNENNEPPGTNITNKFYQTGFGNPYIGGMYYISFGYNIL